ncbi:MAG TPA: haloacid dehalogenase type II [Thermoanaerobaculia bacterium]|jgi:2-haloacid dehalogenase|nr:haloacid dehalogenase type II [Thermoanaerobaculia bacterium]
MFQLVAFDLYGTLLDIGGLAARMEPLVGETAPDLLARWRKEQVERSWECNRTRRYEAWDRVTASALERVAPELPEATRRELQRLWRTVPAYADAGSTLSAIRRRGALCAVLSNGTHAMIENALEAAGLEVDRILSADDVGVYKTDPRVYALLDGEAAREATLFVSSNGWDAEGARRDGRTVAWIDRGGERPGVEPNYRIHSLSEVANIL